MPSAAKLANGLNVFALVIYIPDPLGKFLDDLRRELVPGCSPHAHVSVLPPRPLSVEVEVACAQARIAAEQFEPFEVEAADIDVFPVTNVIYINLGLGAEELRRMHRAMNSGDLAYAEPFEYHPHITLAQEIGAEQTQRLKELANEKWQAFAAGRTFRAERVVFVQNTSGNQWIDLAGISLGAVPVSR